MDVRIRTRPPVATAVIAQATTWVEFPALWGPLLEEVWTFVRAGGLPAGRNVMLYADDVPHVEVGVELEGAWTPGGRVIASRLPAGPTAVAVAPGAPSAEGLAQAHAAVRAWCASNGHELSGARWEIYSHWHEDPARLDTLVGWPVRA